MCPVNPSAVFHAVSVSALGWVPLGKKKTQTKQEKNNENILLYILDLVGLFHHLSRGSYKMKKKKGRGGVSTKQSSSH